MIIEHPARPEWKLTHDAPQPEEKAAGLYRFRLNVEPKKTERLVINEAKPQFTPYDVKTLSEDQIELLLQQKSINPDVERALRRITSQKNLVAEYDGQIKIQQRLMDQIFADQTRLRENMKSLQGSAEEKALLQRYTKQLDDEETQLDALRKKKQDLEGQQQLSDLSLRNMIQQLQMDVTL